jgi:hypothetical protein
MILATWELVIQKIQLKASLGKKFTRLHLNQKGGRVGISQSFQLQEEQIGGLLCKQDLVEKIK